MNNSRLERAKKLQRYGLGAGFGLGIGSAVLGIALHGPQNWATAQAEYEQAATVATPLPNGSEPILTPSQQAKANALDAEADRHHDTGDKVLEPISIFLISDIALTAMTWGAGVALERRAQSPPPGLDKPPAAGPPFLDQ